MSVATGQAVPFLPFKKTSMTDWVELRTTPATAADVTPILSAAVKYMRMLPDEKKKGPNRP